MTIQRRLIIAFVSILSLLLCFAGFQTWVYYRIADVNVNLMQINRITDHIEEIRKAQETYLDLNARRYISLIEDSLQTLKSETGLLAKDRLKSENSLLINQTSDFYQSYEKGLKSFISTNDQYHALVEIKENKIVDMLELIQNEPLLLPQEVYSLALKFSITGFKSSDENTKILNRIGLIGTNLMKPDKDFDTQILGRRLEEISNEILELMESVDQINLKNQSLLFTIDQQLSELYKNLTAVRMSEQAYTNQLLDNLQGIYWSVITLSFIVVIALAISITRRISYGVKTLMESTDRIAGGDYSESIQLSGDDEFAWLADNVNKMTEALRMSNLSIKTYSNQLEHLVKVKTYELTKANSTLEELNETLAKEKEKFATLALTDMLTGLNNRAFFMEALSQKIDEHKRYSKNFALCLFDIDFFKNVNDQYGHLVGDSVLRQFSRLLKRELRISDIVARYGGEEFIIIYTESTLASAIQISERIRVAMMAEVFEVVGLKVTISGGVVSYHGESENVLLKRVDDLLYTAKREGRNRIISG